MVLAAVPMVLDRNQETSINDDRPMPLCTGGASRQCAAGGRASGDAGSAAAAGAVAGVQAGGAVSGQQGPQDRRHCAAGCLAAPAWRWGAFASSAMHAAFDNTLGHISGVVRPQQTLSRTSHNVIRIDEALVVHPSQHVSLCTGVLCIEELDLAIAPLALAVEQEHATGLVDFATAAAEPFHGPRPGAFSFLVSRVCSPLSPSTTPCVPHCVTLIWAVRGLILLLKFLISHLYFS